MQNDNVKSYLHLHLIVFIWGFTAILGELISLDALPLVWFRMLMAVGFIVLFMFYKKTDLTIPRKTMMVFLFLGLVIALHWLTFFKAIKVSNVSVTLACLSTGAFFTSFLEPILYKRKVIWYEVFFGLLVVGGLYIIFNFEGDYYLGIILALTSAFLSALFSVINGKYAKMYDSTVISFYELSGGVLCFSVYLLLTNSFSKEFFILQPSDWLYLIILSSICTAYAFIASVKVMKFISPYTVMLTINLEPIYGIILALLIFKDKEKMSPEFYLGAIIILLTVVLNGIIKYRLKNKRD
ncbi:DMT family transporter [Flavobacterium lacus]|jgi:drug/metabolite transporter (DMT)-like permease|uniref:EamA domain-containing membrane protein RarD n=1 Tax=Flavobacterium lacus TaxID=1353778 RepID=A0A328WMA3_9FLAO|nr:DMT family transporter [Flavobacterium lacus]RAR47430.1 EamA domain-containing membrane protein RarD [Flavobacterium lacus]